MVFIYKIIDLNDDMKKIKNYIQTRGWKQFFTVIIIRLNSWFKEKTGYMFYKKSFIKYSLYQNLQHDINIPEVNSKELEVLYPRLQSKGVLIIDVKVY